MIVKSSIPKIAHCHEFCETINSTKTNIQIHVLILQNLSYDLGDCTRWEYMFPNTDKPLLQIPEAEDDIMEGLDDEEVCKELF